MNQQNKIQVSEFHFQSLRKYMMPLYWRLRHMEQVDEIDKDQAIRELVRDFFLRLRKFRYISIEEMAETLKVSVEVILDFESGKLKSRNLEIAYCDKCHGWFELEYFERRVRECRNPELRSSKEKMAVNLLKRHGILIPDVNLSRLNAPPADVIPIRPKIDYASSVDSNSGPR